MIKELIQNYGEIGATGAFVLIMIWYLRFTTQQNVKREIKHDTIQKEDRDFNRELITGALKGIHKTGLENAEMNRKSIGLQETFQKENVAALKTIVERLNGGTAGMRAIKRLKEIGNKDQRKINKKVKVERRR